MSEPKDEARDLQLDAVLHEVMGVAPAPGLAERIGLRLQTAGRLQHRARLWAAAVLVAGTGVVAAVAWSTRSATTAPDDAVAQEPAPQNPPPSPPQEPVPQDPPAARDPGMLLEVLLRDVGDAARRDAVATIIKGLSPAEVDQLLAAVTRQAANTRDSRILLGLLHDRQRETAAADRQREEAVLAAVRAAVRALADPATRADALARLQASAPAALPVLFEALQQERASLFERKELRAVLEDAHAQLYAQWSRLAEAPSTPRGSTVYADYSENKVVEVDGNGRIGWQLDDVFGAWDVEPLANGNLLVTEFSVSRVCEIDRNKAVVWKFEDLKNPYDADRLANGNTLIADTFGGRVIEVDPRGTIVWSYDRSIRPFDCDRLPNGDTLIADVRSDSVLQVSPAGTVVWQVRGMNNVHDADRLPNGGTLITLRNKGSVVEVDARGRLIWELNGLSSPSDADRLPNGNTLVAENTRVAEYDPRGVMVWQQQATWAVEVCRR